MTERDFEPDGSTMALFEYFKSVTDEGCTAIDGAPSREVARAVGKRLLALVAHVIALAPDQEPAFRRTVYEFSTRLAQQLDLDVPTAGLTDG